MKDMRRGKFGVIEDFINDAPEVVRQVMGKMIVVDIEYLAHKVIEYEAISPEFDRLKQGEKIPEYRVEISSKREGNKNIVDKITFERMK